MKYKEKDRWFIDLEIVSDRNEFTTGAKSDLTAAQVEYCVSELCKAIGAPATPITPASVSEDDYEDGDGEASGEYGGLMYTSDMYNFHSVALWANEKADVKAIIQIIGVMCFKGCVVTCWDGYERGYEREDYLLNFIFRLNQHI